MLTIHRNRTRQTMNNLLSDLVAEPSVEFDNFVRMSSSDFEYILQKISPIIAKKDTHWREAIPPNIRLALTLRFLATGDSYRSMHYLFKMSSTFISRIVPDVCLALIQVLKDMIKLKLDDDAVPLAAIVRSQINRMQSAPECSRFSLQFETLAWNSFESGHGKGAADGVGGSIISLADHFVASRQDIGLRRNGGLNMGIIDAFRFFGNVPVMSPRRKQPFLERATKSLSPQEVTYFTTRIEVSLYVLKSLEAKTRHGVFLKPPCCPGSKNLYSVDSKRIKEWFENRSNLDRKWSDKNCRRRGRGEFVHST
ncbi:hypothetical protein EVAR_51703_1 [Eumeta japonica]|uniref:Uncharacterized protein n=1 Tax=Eumeta variegata TaxID=151549 RepID=A0A4C1XFP0_EUMVA|nr:hypothetical protein EVAR_51703_1 [Eumeta japonica]